MLLSPFSLRLDKPYPSKIYITLFFAIIALIFTWPIFQHIHYWGIQDWDQHLFYHAVPRAELLEYGQIPLWNPYYVGGTVLLANPQSRLLSPSFLLILLCGEVIGLKIEIWLHLTLGLLGTYALARHYKLDIAPALMAAFVFMLNSMVALNLTIGMTWFLSVAYLPWAFLFYLRAFADLKYALLSGLCLALMFFGGGAYPLPITLLFFGFYALFLISLKVHRPWPVAKVLLTIMAFMLCVGAVKFLPAIEFLRQHPRLIYDYSGFSLNALQFSLFSRDQTLEAIVKLPLEQPGFIDGVTGGMDENGMYIGFIPALLFLLGLNLYDKRRLLLLLCFLVFLWMSFGNRPRLELWSWLHLLPVYNSMRVAQRFRLIFMLCLALFAGFGLQTVKNYLERRWPQQTLAQLLPPAILCAVFIDLWLVNTPVFNEAFPIPPVPMPKNDTFYQIWDLPAYDKDGWVPAKANDPSNPFAQYNPYGLHSSYSSLYPAFLANIGTINGYETANVPRQAIPSTSPAYRGEVYLHDTAGTAHISHWSPNRFVIAVKALGQGYLVLNQNYYSGWQVEGDKERAVEDINGLLAVKVSPEDHHLSLRYRPTSFFIGLSVTLATVLGSVIFGVYHLAQSKLPPNLSTG